MASSQLEKANRFHALHPEPGYFVIANAWVVVSQRILGGLGFQALTTSSGASAGVLGRRDRMVSRQEALDHARAIVAATGRCRRLWRRVLTTRRRVRRR